MKKLVLILLNIIFIDLAYGQDQIKKHEPAKVQTSTESKVDNKNVSAIVEIKPTEQLQTPTSAPQHIPAQIEKPAESKKESKPEVKKQPEVKCEANQVEYNKNCGYCPSDSKYDKTTNKCVCNNENSIISNSLTTVDNKNYFKCIPCIENLKPNKEGTACICKDFDHDRKKIQCNKYATNDIKYNRENGTYKCNNPELAPAYNEHKQLLKCYSCPSDSTFDKDKGICICTKPDAKNPNSKIEYSPIVQDDKLVCNPHHVG